MLTLIEMAVMLAVFGVAAALCMRALVWVDGLSDETRRRDQALVLAQNAAETVKSCSGDMEAAAVALGGIWDGRCRSIRYDESGTYRVIVERKESASALLGMATVQVYWGERCLVELDVAWQEVMPGA